MSSHPKNKSIIILDFNKNNQTQSVVTVDIDLSGIGKRVKIKCVGGAFGWTLPSEVGFFHLGFSEQNLGKMKAFSNITSEKQACEVPIIAMFQIKQQFVNSYLYEFVWGGQFELSTNNRQQFDFSLVYFNPFAQTAGALGNNQYLELIKPTINHPQIPYGQVILEVTPCYEY